MNDPPNSYLSIKQASDGIYKDKGSKFIAKAFPVKDLEEIKNIVGLLKSEHPKARHVCYAYRLGFTPEETRSNDDGEPAGSAGLRTHQRDDSHLCVHAAAGAKAAISTHAVHGSQYPHRDRLRDAGDRETSRDCGY